MKRHVQFSDIFSANRGWLRLPYDAIAKLPERSTEDNRPTIKSHHMDICMPSSSTDLMKPPTITYTLRPRRYSYQVTGQSPPQSVSRDIMARTTALPSLPIMCADIAVYAPVRNGTPQRNAALVKKNTPVIRSIAPVETSTPVENAVVGNTAGIGGKVSMTPNQREPIRTASQLSINIAVQLSLTSSDHVISPPPTASKQTRTIASRAAEWKCQPDRWLTTWDEWHEFILGSFNMLLAALGCGLIACYIGNGGYHTLYRNVSDFGLLYLLVTVPVLFFYNEAINYYWHRLFHVPILYRTFHKWHHRYRSPTLYSTTAMHPLESMSFQCLLLIPMFVVPIYVGVYIGGVMYFYYYGMLEHSGIKIDSWWPWQPSTLFHDDHHKYFHCNFGVNVTWFDRFHGTLRRKNRIYGEMNFGGVGKVTNKDNDRNSAPEFSDYFQ